MEKQETLKKIHKKDYEPVISSYLNHGYREDDLEFTEVMIGTKTAVATVKVNRFHSPTDGEFHLSGAMAMILVSQIGIIFSFLDNGLSKKDREVYLRDFSVKCRQRIIDKNRIILKLEITSKVIRKEHIHYRAKFDFGGGSFTGKLDWFMSERPIAELGA